MSPALAGRFFTTSATWKPILEYFTQIISLDCQKSLRKNIVSPILQVEAKLLQLGSDEAFLGFVQVQAQTTSSHCYPTLW